MSNHFSLGSHDMEHQRLIRMLTQYVTLSGTWANRPTNPNVGQRYLATDRAGGGVEYAWNGTSWLSTQLFSLPLGSRDQPEPFTQASHTWDVVMAGHGYGAGVFLVDLEVGFFASTVAQSAVNFYTLACNVVSTAGAVTGLTLTGTTDTKAFPNGAWRELVVGFNAASATLANDKFLFSPNMTPSAAPGTFFFAATLNYRLIG